MVFKDKPSLWFVAFMLFVAAFTFTLGRFSIDRPPAAEAPKSAGHVLAPGAEAVLHHMLADGRIAATEVFDLPGELVGLDIPGLRSVRPSWLIVSFASERVVANVPCGAVEDTAGFIGERDGKVAVFRGRPDACHELMQVTDIDARLLSTAAPDARSATIPWETVAEVPYILDGLQGHNL